MIPPRGRCCAAPGRRGASRRSLRCRAAALALLLAGPTATWAQAVAPTECRYPAVAGDRHAVWAPQARDDAAWRAAHARYVEEAARGGAEVVFLGDSITQGWSRAPDVWAAHYAARHALDFGLSGDRIQHLAWRVQHGTLAGLAPRVLVLMIGTNNLPVRDPAQVAAAIGALLQLLQCEAPASKVLLLGILPRNAGAEHPERAPMDARLHDDIRAVNARLARLADGKRVVFLDMNPAFAADDGGLRPELTRDGLHLSVEGYRVWARTMAPTLDAMLAG